jgi:hypothetical protein
VPEEDDAVAAGDDIAAVVMGAVGRRCIQF